MSDLRGRRNGVLERQASLRARNLQVTRRRTVVATFFVGVAVVFVIALAFFGLPLLAAWAITSIWVVPFWPVFWLSFIVILLLTGKAKASR